MKKSILIIAFVVSSFYSCSNSESVDDSKTIDINQLVGTWNLQSAKLNGEVVSSSYLKHNFWSWYYRSRKLYCNRNKFKYYMGRIRRRTWSGTLYNSRINFITTPIKKCYYWRRDFNRNLYKIKLNKLHEYLLNIVFDILSYVF